MLSLWFFQLHLIPSPPPTIWETWVRSLDWEEPLEEGMATHFSTFAWKIPWMEEPGRLQSMGSLRVGHDWATSHSLFTFMHWRRKWQLTPVFLPGNPMDGGAWWAAVHGVAQSRTRLTWLSSSSSSHPKFNRNLIFSQPIYHWFHL